MNSETIERVLALNNKDRGILFKPVQIRVLKKYLSGINLTENEKRYIRGNLRNKIEAIEKVISDDKDDKDERDTELLAFLKALENYYITGFAALKKNGYGWYYDPKYIEVINTKVEGKIRMNGKKIVLNRVKTIGTNNWSIDPKTGLRYATNERILYDAKRLKQTELIRIWTSLFNRYEKMFVKEPRKYRRFLKSINNENR